MLRAIYYQAKKHKLIITASLLLVLAVSSHSVGTVQAATTCPTDTSRGTVSGTFSLTAAGTYRVYSRMAASSSTANTYVLKIDNTCYNVGGSSVPVYGTGSGWASDSSNWIDTEAGSTTPIDLVLATGSHSYEMIGNADNVRVDRVIFNQSLTCVPVGNGNNCASSPGVTFTAPSSGATVSGTAVSVAATAVDDGGGTISSVAFYVDSATTAAATDTAGPSYGFTLDSTKLSNGAHSVKAVVTDSNGNTANSTVSFTVNNVSAPVCSNPGVVSTPTGLTVVPNGASSGTVSKYTALNLSWSASTPSPACTISGYNIYRDGSTTALNGATLVTGTTYTDSGFVANTSHSYTVQGVDSDVNRSGKSGSVSGTTAQDNLAPNIPASLAATAASTTQVNLSWTASADNPNPGGTGVASYNIYRNNSLTPLNPAPITTTSYSDKTASPSTTYNYAVAAVDGAGNVSAPSTNVSATTQTPPPTCTTNPSAPTAFHSTTQTISSISLAWTASTPGTACTIAGYRIFRADVSTTTPLATVTSGTSYTDANGLTPFTSYTYTVVAFDTNAHTSSVTPTSPATIATSKDTTPPSAPSSVTANDVNSVQVNLTWTASTDNVGVIGYNVYRNGSTTPLNTSLATGTTYSDNTAKASTTYTYQVVAQDAAGNKSPATSSNSVTTAAPPQDTTPPTVPSAPITPLVTAQTAELSWTASTDPGTNASGVAGYNIYLKLGGADVLDATTTATSFTDQCLEPGSTYTYDIKAVDAAGNVSSAVSKTVTTGSAGVYQGDVNCNRVVDYPDLLKEVIDWQKTGMLPSQGDVNGDGTVNYNDLLKTTLDWGKAW